MQPFTLSIFLLMVWSFLPVTSSESPWETEFENKLLKIEERELHCVNRAENFDAQIKVLRIKNKAQTSLKLGFCIEYIKKDGSIFQPACDEDFLQLEMAPGQLVSGSCESKRLRYVLAFNNLENGQFYRDLRLTNLQVEVDEH